MRNRYYTYVDNFGVERGWAIADREQVAGPIATGLTQHNAERVAELLSLYGVERFVDIEQTFRTTDVVTANDLETGRCVPEYPLRRRDEVQANEVFRYSEGSWVNGGASPTDPSLNHRWVEVRPAPKPAPKTETIPWYEAYGRKVKFGGKWERVKSIVQDSTHPRAASITGNGRSLVGPTVEALVED